MSVESKKRTVRMGEVYQMQFDGRDSEQGGWRPGLVFQNNIGNRFSPNIIALPLTSSLKKRNQPTHVVLCASQTGLPRDSMVLCENPERMSKDRLGSYLTTLSAEDMKRVAAASLLATGAISYLEPELLLSLWRRAVELNSAVPNLSAEVRHVQRGAEK